MATWRLARSLQVLSGEVRAISPDATIWDLGDPEHAARASDHNPNADGVVCAIDIVDDAALDLAAIAERIRQRRHPALKYVIHNRLIASVRTGYAWVLYTGPNPHTGHVHVSVGVGPDGQSTGPYDNTEPWHLEEDMNQQQADQLAAAHWTLTAIDDGDGGRIALHQWASRIGSTVAQLAAALDVLPQLVATLRATVDDQAAQLETQRQVIASMRESMAQAAFEGAQRAEGE